MRTYKIMIFMNGLMLVNENHNTLAPIKKRVKAILDNMNLNSFYDKGEFIETINNYTNTRHYKRFRIKIEVPNLEFLIIKTTAGDINQELFLEEWYL